MRRKFLVLLLYSALLVLAGCKKHETPPAVPRSPAQIDVCGLIKSQEIEATQGSPIRQVKNSASSDGEFLVAQCFYTADEFSKSVSLAVTQVNPTSPSNRSPKNFWKETFGRYAGEEKERDSDTKKQGNLRDETGKEGRGGSTPPKKINGIGDDAYWIANRFGGVLYVLKNDRFIRISVGGSDNEATKLEKSKALAEKALNRL